MTTAETAAEYPCFKCVGSGKFPLGSAQPCGICEATGIIGNPVLAVSPLDHLIHAFYPNGNGVFSEAACTHSIRTEEVPEASGEEIRKTSKCHLCMVYMGRAFAAAQQFDRDRYQL